MTPHLEYLRLNPDKELRCRAYRDLFKEQLTDQDLHKIRQAAHYCQPLGDDRFRKKIEDKVGRPLGKVGRGRPRKPGKRLD